MDGVEVPEKAQHITTVVARGDPAAGSASAGSDDRLLAELFVSGELTVQLGWDGRQRERLGDLGSRLVNVSVVDSIDITTIAARFKVGAIAAFIAAVIPLLVSTAAALATTAVVAVVLAIFASVLVSVIESVVLRASLFVLFVLPLPLVRLPFRG